VIEEGEDIYKIWSKEQVLRNCIALMSTSGLGQGQGT
jgi:hypothetical protein